ncbi:carbohydrate sulfotransferase 11-like [Littorina saxatilis]|uniref:Carbohydrate sulfotransferase n=1 Tax=Littorina saxatilis TaxID=31220 RepID=A0AAN9G1U9_9CAEN
MRRVGSVTSCAKVTLCLLNIWVLCVILVVALGHWRVFDADLSLHRFHDDSHLVVMRELKEEANLKTGGFSTNKSKSAEASPVVKKQIQEHKPAAALTAVQQEIEDRVSTMTQWCARLHPRSRDVASIPAERLSMIMVDREHRLLFCQIPGVAQNDWRRIFIYLSGKVDVTQHLKISAYDAHSKYAPLLKKLSDFKPEERKKIVEESMKVVFVRDPFERLVSTYQNKFQARYSKYFHESFGRKIIQRYRKNATAKSKKEGNDVTFNEFVRFVLDSEHETDGPLNEHWERYYKQCHPCVLHYDFVGKFETLADDTVEVLTRAKVIKKLSAPYVADTFRNSEKSLKTFFQTVSQADLKRLWNIYYPDYNLFSYSYPEVLHTLFQKSFHDY